MAALSAERDTQHRGELVMREYKMAASSKVYKGGLVMLDGGYLKAAATATGKIVVGIAVDTVDNTGSAGALTCKVYEGEFLLGNGETLAQADVPATVYAADDAGTLYDTSTGKSVAGILTEVVSAGCWTKVSLAISKALAA